eukprot:CAMPEP_0183727538 /NCGR_PEP_ID=MMETSP0737-20130205/25803_1 /TAXON_ID=385413 /ORGANISM="Thalassiosira miniscula, Strain CCMP1093" /LENGTH=519 /DNA_ID=CAMNT_0025959201 /DNA_START=225 /DNA_END=1784 /DNA_ORIENTATION=+
MAPVSLSSLAEHVVKASIYLAFVLHSVQSALHSSTTFSYTINSLIGVFMLWMIQAEVSLAIKRIQRKLPPGYLGIPIFREIKFILTATTGGIWRKLHENRRKYGTMFLQSLFGQTSILMGGQDDLQFVFNCDRKALTDVAWPPNIVMLLGPGAVPTQTGKYHRVLRRLLEPYFAPKFVTNYLTIMDRTTLEELDSWASSGDFVSSEVFKMYALKLFYASSFGRIDEDVIVTLHDDFKVWLGGFLSVTDKRIPGTAFDEAMKARARILDTIDVLMENFKRGNPEDSERAQTTIMGRLIYGKDKDDNRVLSRDEIKDNLLTLIFAGHDTTYLSISTILYHLSQNPDAMAALVEESSSLCEPLESEELKNAPVLNACVHESLRMDPPIPGAFRKMVKDTQHKGYTFEKGTTLNYSILMASTNESLYKNHGTFNMKRFLPKDHPLYQADMDAGIDPTQGRANYPIFGGGSHICLGKAFAQLELRVLVARLTKHYHVEVRNPQKLYFPVNGWNIEFRLTKRKDC